VISLSLSHVVVVLELFLTFALVRILPPLTPPTTRTTVSITGRVRLRRRNRNDRRLLLGECLLRPFGESVPICGLVQEKGPEENHGR